MYIQVLFFKFNLTGFNPLLETVKMGGKISRVDDCLWIKNHSVYKDETSLTVILSHFTFFECFAYLLLPFFFFFQLSIPPALSHIISHQHYSRKRFKGTSMGADSQFSTASPSTGCSLCDSKIIDGLYPRCLHPAAGHGEVVFNKGMSKQLQSSETTKSTLGPRSYHARCCCMRSQKNKKRRTILKRCFVQILRQHNYVRLFGAQEKNMLTNCLLMTLSSLSVCLSVCLCVCLMRGLVIKKKGLGPVWTQSC